MGGRAQRLPPRCIADNDDGGLCFEPEKKLVADASLTTMMVVFVWNLLLWLWLWLWLLLLLLLWVLVLLLLLLVSVVLDFLDGTGAGGVGAVRGGNLKK